MSDIEAGRLSEELRRRGVAPTVRVRAIIESIESETIPITAIKADGGAFDWLGAEPDFYSDADLRERYR